jgi:gliding motility-associated-like protein
MKRFLNLFFLLVSFTIFSQVITVNTSTYTVPQLVNNVLINSPCVAATNITSSTGTNVGVNGIGYFTNTNPNFPIQSGVILSTGSAINAPGPNTSVLSNGTPAWGGDVQLQNTLAASGINMVSTNATVLEFDFTPVTSNFSFDFVFASEEYGNFQCQFSDAFAFLLTNTVTGITTNLAIVPGTNSPISVLTIRDFLYNSNCASVNAGFFGSFNGGSNATGSATNFNGQTVLMTAGATLIPNTPYHIKLVIADRNDSLSDSAIFLSSTSFNIGQDVLGADLTVANNTAICFGGNHTITTGLSAANYTFVWTQNGNPIAGQTGPTLNVTQPGTYGVTYTKILNPCQPITNSVLIEFYPQISTPNPVDLYKCNTGSAFYQYDLAINTPKVLVGVPAGYLVSYFSSMPNAVANTLALPNSYLSAGNETIYVRITNPTTLCYIIKTFQLLLTPPPVANTPTNISNCETTLGSGTANFNFGTINSSILGLQSSSIYIVSYHNSQSNADSATSPLPNTGFTGTNGQIIYVRVQNATDSTCYTTTSFSLLVNPKPLVDSLTNAIVCVDYTLPALTNGNYFTSSGGTGIPLFAGNIINTNQTIYIYSNNGFCASETSFAVIIIDLNSITPPSASYCDSYVLPFASYATYYTQPHVGGVLQPGGVSISGGSIITSTQTLYLYYKSLLPPFCEAQTSFTITINNTPTIANIANVFACASYMLPVLSVGNYFTGIGGTGTMLAANSSITSTQTIYVFAQTATIPSCPKDVPFKVFIGLPTLPNVTECVKYVLPALEIGSYYTATGGPTGTGIPLAVGTEITSTQTIFVYAVGSDGCAGNSSFNVNIVLPYIAPIPNVLVCASYQLPVLANGNYFTATHLPLGTTTGTALSAGNIISTSKRIYVYLNNGGGCQNEVFFDVTILPSPPINSRSDVDVYTSYTLTPLTAGNYYSAPGGPNGTGNLIPSGTVLTAPSTIVYIYAATTSTPPCVLENNFTVRVYTKMADAPLNVARCVSYTLPSLTNGNYYTATGGPTGTGSLLNAGQVINAPLTTLYVYVAPPSRGLTELDENSFTITIVPQPIANSVPLVNRTVCDNDATNDGVTSFDLTTLNSFVLGTQIAPEFSVTYYTTNANAILVTSPITATTLTSIFARVSNSLAPSCFDVINIQLVVNKLPDPTPVKGVICVSSTTGAILNPYTINSNLSTSLNSFVWTDANNVIVGNNPSITVTTPGIYTVVATSLVTGCPSKPATVSVVQSQPAITSYSVGNAFSESQNVTIQATGSGGIYEYQIDGGNYQDSNVFENVSFGNHTILVRDKNGCGISPPINVLVANYPHYFTPNNDGFNDYWNVVGLKQQPDATIYIYDRYGKFLKQISPTSLGWDGMFNGEMSPATDYWFTVNYIETNIPKVFKSHFTLKR